MLALSEKDRPPQRRTAEAGSSTKATGLREHGARIVAARCTLIFDLTANVTRAKGVVKRLLIDWYCSGMVPKWAVTAAFRILRLERS